MGSPYTSYEHTLAHIKWAEVQIPDRIKRQSRINKRFAYAGAVVSAVTGLSVWPLLEASNEWWGRALVTAMGLAGALIVSIPAAANWQGNLSKWHDLYKEVALLMDEALQTDSSAPAKVATLAGRWASVSGKLFDAQLDVGEPPIEFQSLMAVQRPKKE